MPSQTSLAQQARTMDFTPLNIGNTQPQVQIVMGGTPPNALPQHFMQYQTQMTEPALASFLNVQWCPKELATFSGKFHEDVVQWFRIVKDYLELMGGTPEL